ncbi:CinY protein [Streptomyces sp. NPDC005805]|uniref:CinY protein n=1 Tax=Streptomyces sp. NPDC005805 TaxID=3157068 RepID=UPI0033D0A1E2
MSRTRARRRALPAAVLTLPLLLTGVPTQPAHAFGTINGAGQHAEHERITRAALACAPGRASDGRCFEPRSLDQLAGRTGTFGAVGAPDSDENLTLAAHCDNADFLDAPGYARTRAQASAQLVACVQHLQRRFAEGIAAAPAVLTANGTGVRGAETDLSSDCTFVGGVAGRAKCNAVEGFGRALHGVQDFYAHSNWSDSPIAILPVGPRNPPGLRRTGASPLLALSTGVPPAASSVPRELSTGCFSLLWGCEGRIRHDDLNKDHGLIDPRTGEAGSPATPRGRVEGNFARAVQNAVADTRRQWNDFRNRLIALHGAERGARIACALTSDTPVQSCR